jgi:CDP-diacylglycerol--glycerol-3-phosphate 3-phosphatidyltransferase
MNGQPEPGFGSIPNMLSLSRIVITVPLCAAIAYDAWGIALVLWAWVSVTDWLDGALARAWGQTSALGRVLDPLADKVAVLGTLVCLIPAGQALGYLSPWMVAVLIGREFMVTGLRSELERRGSAFGADIFGKLKMVAQIVVISVALVVGWLGRESLPVWMIPTLLLCVWIMLLATILSGCRYAWMAIKVMTQQRG